MLIWFVTTIVFFRFKYFRQKRKKNVIKTKKEKMSLPCDAAKVRIRKGCEADGPMSFRATTSIS